MMALLKALPSLARIPSDTAGPGGPAAPAPGLDPVVRPANGAGGMERVVPDSLLGGAPGDQHRASAGAFNTGRNVMMKLSARLLAACCVPAVLLAPPLAAQTDSSALRDAVTVAAIR